MEVLFTLHINKYKILAIVWNLSLAMIPVIISYYLIHSVKLKQWKAMRLSDRSSFILIFLFWLFMFPNTAYLFTLVRHLVNYCHDFNKYRVCLEGTMWMTMFFFVYAIIGLPTFYYSLLKMAQVFKKVFNKTLATILPVVVIPLTSIAVMFGLFERFNSWDVLTNPFSLASTAIKYFTDLNLFFNFLIFTLGLYLIYYGMDFFIWKIIKQK